MSKLQKINDCHLQQLYAFTRKHYIEFYDVQTELVDHLANGIEAQWQNDAKLSFESALRQEFKKFGVFGFMGVLEQKTKAMSKQYFKLLLHFTKEWFRLPKIAVTITLFFLIKWGMQFGKINALVLIGCILLIFLIRVNVLSRSYKKRTKETGKKWLFEHLIFKTASFNLLMILVNIFNIVNLTNLFQNSIFSYIIACAVTLLVLSSYITLVVFPKKAKTLLEKQYPEYKLS